MKTSNGRVVVEIYTFLEEAKAAHKSHDMESCQCKRCGARPGYDSLKEPCPKFVSGHYITVAKYDFNGTQVSIDGPDGGFRICGPKSIGRLDTSKKLVRHELSMGDIEGIRRYLNEAARAIRSKGK